MRDDVMTSVRSLADVSIIFIYSYIGTEYILERERERESEASETIIHICIANGVFGPKDAFAVIGTYL